ncbi:MAG: threonine ammonia-lyase, partial [Actinobacteria bacterium]|nr:threonine ammonia-lyase [Actinomycetota bacterium]NIX51776.1 threonine ammonia-lyase [Actinomycetota bacterium]
MVDDIVVVGEASIEAAVQTLLIDAKLLVEGAGATPLALLHEQSERFRDRRVGLVACGANIDPRILSSILMRGMSRAGHLASLRVSITDQTGTLARVAKIIGDTGGNIVETRHQRMFARVPVKRAELDVLVETRDARHAGDIIRRLEEAGFPTRRRSEM